MRVRVGWLAGGVGVLGAVVYRALRRGDAAPPAVAEPDPRAEELRSRIAESRALVDEREEFEAAETPVDQAEPSGPNEPVEDRRRHVHERGRAAVDRMRRTDTPE